MRGRGGRAIKQPPNNNPRHKKHRQQYYFYISNRHILWIIHKRESNKVLSEKRRPQILDTNTERNECLTTRGYKMLCVCVQYRLLVIFLAKHSAGRYVIYFGPRPRPRPLPPPRGEHASLSMSKITRITSPFTHRFIRIYVNNNVIKRNVSDMKGIFHYNNIFMKRRTYFGRYFTRRGVAFKSLMIGNKAFKPRVTMRLVLTCGPSLYVDTIHNKLIIPRSLPTVHRLGTKSISQSKLDFEIEPNECSEQIGLETCFTIKEIKAKYLSNFWHSSVNVSWEVASDYRHR